MKVMKDNEELVRVENKYVFAISSRLKRIPRLGNERINHYYENK